MVKVRAGEAMGILRGLPGSTNVLNPYYLTYTSDPCVYCGGSAGTREHIVPLSQGGVKGWENKVAACGPCNRRRGSQPLLRFLWETS